MIDPRVARALEAGAPVVALESTIITHGMPFPQNFETAVAVEAAVRDGGAQPATIAILDGGLAVGLTHEDLERLARIGSTAAKASRRDVAAVTMAGGTAGTTVATTMQIAAMAGISIFATGGIGGVHRGAEDSFDISADLVELARTPVAVVCAGAKSILDIPKTLEMLETKGVPVLGYRTDDFPAFYVRSSGEPVEYRYEQPEQIAAVIKRHFALDGSGGVVVANPIPETHALKTQEVAKIIETAVAEAVRSGISGKDVTPYLLQHLFERTDGKSLDANIALVKNNARVAAEISVALAELRRARPP